MAGKREYVRDALAAILREHAATFVLTTDEVANHLNAAGVPNPNAPRWAGFLVYPHLRILEKRGLAQRVYVDGMRAVCWMWAGPLAPADDLEAMYAAPAAEPPDTASNR